VERKMKRSFVFMAAISVVSMLASPALAQGAGVVDVGELLDNAPDYVGEITVRGELIGDYGFRGDGSMWTQLNDDSYAFDPVLDDGELTGSNVGVAVRIPVAVAEELDPPGGYRVRGPVVLVTGTWKYHDVDRGGESYIEVATLQVVEPGRPLAEHPNFLVLAAGIVLAGGALYLRRRPHN
jgi:hypothetical protein